MIAGLDGPLGVAADGGHVYWTEYVDPVATIGRAGVDGTGVDRGFILAEWIAVQLAVDDRHIYWSYEGDQRIGRANLDGSGVTPGFIAGLHGDVGDLAVTGDHIYWTLEEIMGRADLDGTNVDQDFITSDQSMISLAADLSSGCPASGPGKATAKKTQGQKREKIRVKVRVKATDRLTAEVRGKVKLNPAYALEPVSKRVDTGESKAVTLKPKSRRAQESIAAALTRGESRPPSLTVRLTDDAGNTEVEKLSVKLTGT